MMSFTGGRRLSAIAAAAALRASAFAFFWWVISEGDPSAWFVGAPAVAAAAAISLWLAPFSLPSLRVVPLLRFIPFFIVQAARGGFDILRRAYDPRLPLAPAIRSYSLAGLSRPQQIVFALLVSLMPGTLSARLERDRLILHVLDTDMPFESELQRVQAMLKPAVGARNGAGVRP